MPQNNCQREDEGEQSGKRRRPEAQVTIYKVIRNLSCLYLYDQISKFVKSLGPNVKSLEHHTITAHEVDLITFQAKKMKCQMHAQLQTKTILAQVRRALRRNV